MSLYQYAREGDVERIRDALSSERAVVRRRAAEHLGELVATDDQASLDALLRVASDDADEQTRAAAVDALAAIGTPAVEQLLAAFTGHDEAGAEWVTVRRLAAALDADRPELRIAAVHALADLDDASAVPVVVDALSDPDPRVRRRACRACGTIADPRAVPALVDRLTDVPPVRRAAANALGTIGTDAALEPLVELLDDADESIRRTAAGALGSASTARPIEPLASALGDPSPVVREAAVYSLLGLLSNAPTERSHAIRDRVVETLRDVDDSGVVDPLVEILTAGQETRQRRNAAWILGRIADPNASTAVEALAAALGDDDAQTARFATTSLATLGGPVVEDRVLDRLDAEYPASVRANAVFVLGRIGGRETLERIEALTDDESPAVRKRAFSAVTALRSGGV